MRRLQVMLFVIGTLITAIGSSGAQERPKSADGRDGGWQNDYDKFCQRYQEVLKNNQDPKKEFVGRKVEWQLKFKEVDDKGAVQFDGVRRKLTKGGLEGPWATFQPKAGSKDQWEKIKPGTSVKLRGTIKDASAGQVTDNVTGEKAPWGIATVVDVEPLPWPPRSASTSQPAATTSQPSTQPRQVECRGTFLSAHSIVEGKKVVNTFFTLKRDAEADQGGPLYFGFYGNDMADADKNVPFTNWKGLRGTPSGTRRTKTGNPEQEVEVQMLKSPRIVTTDAAQNGPKRK